MISNDTISDSSRRDLPNDALFRIGTIVAWSNVVAWSNGALKIVPGGVILRRIPFTGDYPNTAESLGGERG